MVEETPVQQSRDRRLSAMVKILLCLLGYLGFAVVVYWSMVTRQVTAQGGIAFFMITNFLLLLAALVVIFKPYKK